RGVVRLRHGPEDSPGVGGALVTLSRHIRHGFMRRGPRASSGPRPTVKCPMSWTISHCDPDTARELGRELGVTDTTAPVLVRRGFADAASARAFLDAKAPPHDPFLLGDMPAACTAILAAIDAGKRICVHGDYDADGICATALAVTILRELGVDVDWHLPNRFDDASALSLHTIDR